MKCQIPQISWHSRDPVLSIDFQSYQNSFYRLASGGTDSHVLIWYVTFNENKSINIECASDLYRHNKSVNVVRFSPNGEILASGDDEGAIFLWKLKDREQSEFPKDEDDNTNKEDWYPIKLLRGHLEDIYDLSWSKDGNFIVSASMDNSAIIWDTQKFQKIHMFSDFKGYVQGIAWDPLNQFIASLGSDRTLRIHSVSSKKVLHRVLKSPWSVTTEKGSNKVRLFYDDTLQSYCRRLTFTPDGELLIAPSGICETDDKLRNTTYVFSRHCLNKPALHLPSGDKYTIAVKCNPLLFELRGSKTTDDKENDSTTANNVRPMIDLPYRMIIAVAASDSILMYDTQQLIPFAFISNIHYTHLTDLSWSHDGRILVASSTDGYCSFVVFSEEELGKVYVPKTPPKKENLKEKKNDENVPQDSKIKSNEVEIVHVPNYSNIISTKPRKEVILDEDKTIQNKKLETEKVNEKSNSPSTNLLLKSKESTEETSVSKSGKKPEKIRSIKSFFSTPKLAQKKEKMEIDSKNDDIIIEKIIEKIEKPIRFNESFPIASASNSRDVDCIKKTDQTTIKLDISCEEAMDCEIISSSKGLLQNSILDEEMMDLNENCSKSLGNQTTNKRDSKCCAKLDFSAIKVVKESGEDFSVLKHAEKDTSVSKPNVDIQNVLKKSDDNLINAELSKEIEISAKANEKTYSQKVDESTLNIPNPDDWKLELTRDGDTQDDISDISNNEQANTSTSIDKKDTTPKRRVQFITLSSKTSFQ